MTEPEAARSAGFLVGNAGEPPACPHPDGPLTLAWLEGWRRGWERYLHREGRYRFGAPP
jgi:hypothetical protein